MPEQRIQSCGCYAAWDGERWRVTASSFLCHHRQGEAVAAPQPPEAIDGQLGLVDDQAELETGTA